jgi:S-adenosylmethionine uptake transporter
MDAVMKTLVLATGSYTTLLWRNWAGVAVSGLLYGVRRPPRPSWTAVKLHIVRGAVTAAVALAFFWGLARIPMAQAIALTFTAPLLSLFFSALLLRERISRITVLASLIASIGVAIILFGQWELRLGPEAFRGAIAVLGAAFGYAVNIILMRRQAMVAGPIEVAFSQSLIVAVLLSFGAPFFATHLAAHHAPLILLAALLAVASLLLLAWAYARGEASYLAPSEYSAFIWASIFGWLLFAEHVAVATAFGAFFIIAGCLLAARGGPNVPADLEGQL